VAIILKWMSLGELVGTDCVAMVGGDYYWDVSYILMARKAQFVS
jgi:hypothetical protein